MKLAAIIITAFVAATLGIPFDHVQHEVLGRETARINRGRASSDQQIAVRIALKQKNLDQGMKLLLEVSDPSSPKYGQHYSEQQVIDTFAPQQESFDAVTAWLVKAGVPAGSIKIPKSKGWVHFEASVGKLESLLGAKYSIFEEEQTSHELLGTEAYHLPADIAQHVDFVYPGTSMAKIKTASKQNSGQIRHREAIPAALLQRITSLPEETSTCDQVMTPACIKALHGIADASKSPNPNNAVGVYELGNEMYQQSDLDLFYSKFAPKIPKGTGPHVNLVDWAPGTGPSAQYAQGEAALDFDMIYPIIYPQTTELYQLGKASADSGIFNYFFDAIDGPYCKDDGDDPKSVSCGTFKRTNVVSFSYGEAENTYSLSFTKRQCDEYMKLGLQGTTVAFASGDGGVAGGHGGQCGGSDGKVFTSIFGTACPYALSVGATELPKGSKIGDAQHVAFTNYSPGGGFSNIWGRPSYQDAAVSSWFKSHNPGFPTYNNTGTKGSPPANGDNGVYNRGGRGYPDLSAVGNWGAYVFDGEPGTNGGTSMSAPIVVSMINLINEDRLAAGKKPLGFVNPALYKNPDMFEDITHGGMAADDSAACDGKSFQATSGWDPASGLGTPKYAQFAKYLGGLP